MNRPALTLLALLALNLSTSALAKDALNITGKLILKGEVKPKCKVTLNGKQSETITYKRDVTNPAVRDTVVLTAECNKYEKFGVKIDYPVNASGKGELKSAEGNVVPFSLKIAGADIVPGHEISPRAGQLSLSETIDVDFSAANALPAVSKGAYEGTINFTVTSGS